MYKDGICDLVLQHAEAEDRAASQGGDPLFLSAFYLLNYFLFIHPFIYNPFIYSCI